jgi:glycosyltransferase EpsE
MTETLRKPVVSVVMATFNESADILRKSIESILNQTFSDFELLIIDDSTKEETKMVIDYFSKDVRVRVIRCKKRIGFAKGLNLGFSQAKGQFIARMDGDDISLKNRLELQVNYLKKHPKISVVGGYIYIIDGNDQIISYRKYPTSGFMFKFHSIYRNPLAHPTVMLRHECVEKGFYYDESFFRAEDIELWLRMQKNGFNLANMKNYLLKYRVFGDLSIKRNNVNWSYNYKARVKNFSLRAPISSLVSIIISFAYTIIPNFIVKAVYRKENNKNKEE